MDRLRRFENHQFIGTRDDMIVYDCDVPAEFAALQRRADDGRLLERNLLQTFSPDTIAEARNRGFRAQ